MSTYVLMRILESTPSRYDLGIRILTLGRLDKAYDRLASLVMAGQQILDLGCGTGALTLRAARRGARVKGIDINAPMLEIAAQRIKAEGLEDKVDLMEMGVAQLDTEKTNHYDAVMSGLCLSELSDDELAYTVQEAARILRPGGLLLIADEMKPEGMPGRLVHAAVRAPLAALAYAFTQRTTHAISKLPQRMVGAGLAVVSVRLDPFGCFGEIIGRKPAGNSSWKI